ncbi:MAG: arylsulfatase [Opitutales bacterium]|jgi:arylsulfatase A|nr:arylsulfatase [Opitutales bacterium]
MTPNIPVPLLFFLAAISTLGIQTVSAESSPPNIIYILADDMGYGDVKAFNPDCQFPTPNLDRMADEGMLFADAHTNSSVCTPTRYGILTGRYAWRTEKKSGVTQGHSTDLIAPDQETVASLLKRQGYSTACFGKWHLGMQWSAKDGEDACASDGKNVDIHASIKQGPLDRGFDYYFGISASLNMPPHAFIENRKVLGDLFYAADRDEIKEAGLAGAKPGWVSKEFRQDQVLPELAQRAARWIEAINQKPFFLYMPLNAPHSPIVPNDRFKGKSGIGDYGDFCMEVDWAVGQILDTVDRLGIANNTLIIFTADNGCSPTAKFEKLHEQGHYPSYIYRGLKGSLWEAGHRVPFIARWPQTTPAGSRNDQLICVTDMIATVAEILAIDLPDETGEDSVSFLDALKGKEKPDESRGGIVHHSDSGWFSIRDSKWKLVLHEAGGTRRSNPADQPLEKPARIQLFNLEEDPSETTNLQALHPEKAVSLQRQLARFIQDGRSTSGSPQTYNKGKRWEQIEMLSPFLEN